MRHHRLGASTRQGNALTRPTSTRAAGSREAATSSSSTTQLSSSPAPPPAPPPKPRSAVDTPATSANVPAGRLRICVARREEHFTAVARVWAEALLLPGLTELAPPPPTPSGEAELRLLTERVAQRLQQSYDRKLIAAAESRSLRRRGEALLQALRRGGLTGLEYQLMLRQLEAVRRDLRRARRRRLWACLLAWREVSDGDGGDGGRGGEGVGGAFRRQEHGEEVGEIQQTQIQIQVRQQERQEHHGRKPGRWKRSEQRTERQSNRAAAAVAAAAAAAAAGPAGSAAPAPAAATHWSGEGGGGVAGAATIGVAAGLDAGRDGGSSNDSGGGAAVGSRRRGGGGGGGGTEGDGGRLGSLAGYVLLSVSQPMALLPPPLPSRAPQQLHVDALAVRRGHRRRGVGSALLAAAERLASRWGGSSLWLHVEASNDAAVQMYSDHGYGIARIETRGPVTRLAAALAGAGSGWRPAGPLALWPQGGGHRYEAPVRQIQPTPRQLLRSLDPSGTGQGGQGQLLAHPGGELNGEGRRDGAGAVEQWRRRHSGRRFVMRKQLLPQPAWQQQDRPTDVQEQPSQTSSGAAAGATRGSVLSAGACLGPQAAAAVAGESVVADPDRDARSPALADAAEDCSQATHGSSEAVPGSRPGPTPGRRAGVYEWR